MHFAFEQILNPLPACPTPRSGTRTKNGGRTVDGVVALPWAALEGSTLTRDWPRRRPGRKALVAVPAFRTAKGTGWTAELWYDDAPAKERDDTLGPLHRCGWATKTLRDAPCGLEAVQLTVHRRRWQTTDKQRQFQSPLPAALTGSTTGELKVTPALTDFLRDVRSRLDISSALVVRSVGGNPLVAQRLRRAAGGTAPPTAFVHEPNRFILCRPTVMPVLLALDEIHLGDTYWTVISDNTARTAATMGQGVVGLCRGRTKDELVLALKIVADWYREARPEHPRPEYVTCDLWGAFIEASKDPAVFGETVQFSVDPFHFRRQLRLARQRASRLCPAGCADTARCGQCRHNDEAGKLLSRLLECRTDEAWDAFDEDWRKLRTRPWRDRAWLEAYANFDGLLQDGWIGSRRAVLEQTAKAQDRHSNARAEAINRRIREVMRHLRFRKADHRLEAIMTQLHAGPVAPPATPVTVPPSVLCCPSCRTPAGLPARTSWQDVAILPRAITPLYARVPTRIECPECGPQAVQAAPLSQELAQWVQQPLQAQLSVSTLRGLTGLRTEQLRKHRTPPALPARSQRPDTVIYDEFWMTTRVWLMLVTPGGELLDLHLVGTLTRQRGSRFQEDLHGHVARAGAAFLKRHEPKKGYVQVVLWKEYPQLYAALKDGKWRRRRSRQQLPFVLAPFCSHNLPRRAVRAAVRQMEADEIGRLASFLSWKPKDVEQRPEWQNLRRTQPTLAQILEEARILKGLLSTGTEPALRTFYRRAPDMRVAAQDSAETIRQRQWVAWLAIKGMLFKAADLRANGSPRITAGYHPHLRKLVRSILRDALAPKSPELLRARALAVAHARYTARAARQAELAARRPRRGKKGRTA